MVLAALIKTGVPLIPMLLDVAVGTSSAIVPLFAPKVMMPLPLCVIEPPVVLLPLLVSILMVAPLPAVILPPPSTAPPVPPAAAFTLMAMAVAVALVVVMEPPEFNANPLAPLPSLFAAIVIVPEADSAPFMLTLPGEVMEVVPPVNP